MWDMINISGKRLIMVCCIFVGLSACSTNNQVVLNVKSEPPGAKVYSAGQGLGVTPMNLYYDISPNFSKQGSMRVQDIDVVWASGAKSSSQNLTLLSKHTNRQEITFTRPASHPNLELDLLVAANSSNDSSGYNASGIASSGYGNTTDSSCAGSAFGSLNPCNPFSEYSSPFGSLNPDNPFSEVSSPFGSLNPDNPFSEVSSPFGSLNPDNPFSEVSSPFGSLNPDNPFSEVSSPFGSLNPNNPFGEGTISPLLGQ